MSFGQYRNNQNRKPPCKFYAQGKCMKGNACQFSHDQNQSNNRFNQSNNQFQQSNDQSNNAWKTAPNPFAVNNQPSNPFGQSNNPFAVNNQPSNPFGQTSNPFAVNNQLNNPFGGNSGFGNTFGQVAGSAFSSAIGQSTNQTNNPFAPSNPQPNNPFAPTNQASNPFANSNPFGALNQPAQTGGFGATPNPFAPSNQSTNNASPFTQNNLFQTNGQPNPFVQPTNQPAMTSTANPFAASPFGPVSNAATAQPANPFAPAQPPFGQPTNPFAPQQPGQANNPFAPSHQPTINQPPAAPIKQCQVHKSPAECIQQFNADVKPITWPFSCYSHGSDVPVCMIGDLSYEEVRWLQLEHTTNQPNSQMIEKVNQQARLMQKYKEHLKSHPELLGRDVSGWTLEQQFASIGENFTSVVPSTIQTDNQAAAPVSNPFGSQTTDASNTQPSPFASFAQPQPAQPTANPFAPPANPAQQPAPANPFISSPTAAQPGASTFNMSPAEAETCFRAAAFEMGRIPDMPPPEGLR